jgi:hypothetical protein
MKVKELYEELKDKQFFKDFKTKNPGIFLCAGFFVLDLELKTEKIQLDFYNPTTNKIEISEFPFKEVKKQENSVPGIKEEKINLNKIKKIPLEIKIDIDDLESFCNKIIKKNKALLKPTKIIAILKDDSWNLTCMDNHLGMVRIKINAISGKEQSFERLNMMEFMGVKKN